LAKTDTSSTSHRIEEFAEDLGKLLGTARAKAEGWLSQRQSIVKQLTQLRDEATKLLNDLGHEAEKVMRRGRRAKIDYAPAPRSKKPRRRMSAKARAAISAAQKKRWAKQKAAEKK
jgi:hypothetical protein